MERPRAVVAAILVALSGSVAAFAWTLGTGRRPPDVEITDDHFTVAAWPYSVEVAREDIVDIELVDGLPALWRTNGYGDGRFLHGHVRVEELSDGWAFVDADMAPFVVVHTPDSYVIFNASDRRQTRRWFEELARPVP